MAAKSLVFSGRANPFALRRSLDRHIAAHGLDQAVIEDLIEKAHQVCPYSNATRGNVDVRLAAK